MYTNMNARSVAWLKAIPNAINQWGWSVKITTTTPRADPLPAQS